MQFVCLNSVARHVSRSLRIQLEQKATGVAGALAGESDNGTNIKNLVEHAGGIVEAQLPKPVSSNNEALSQWLLIGSENDKAKDQKTCIKQYAAGLTFHGRSMLIDSIMQQCLDRKHGILFST